jgi:hypothetical protein
MSFLAYIANFGVVVTRATTHYHFSKLVRSRIFLGTRGRNPHGVAMIETTESASNVNVVEEKGEERSGTWCCHNNGQQEFNCARGGWRTMVRGAKMATISNKSALIQHLKWKTKRGAAVD